TTLYAGGYFSNIGGATRNYLAALDPATGAIINGFTANTNNSVHSLALSGNTLYVGGSFTAVNGTTRSRIASVDATTGAVRSFDPNANTFVFQLLLSDNILY